jgi:hypothetical protein
MPFCNSHILITESGKYMEEFVLCAQILLFTKFGISQRNLYLLFFTSVAVLVTNYLIMLNATQDSCNNTLCAVSYVQRSTNA